MNRKVRIIITLVFSFLLTTFLVDIFAGVSLGDLFQVCHGPSYGHLGDVKYAFQAGCSTGLNWENITVWISVFLISSSVTYLVLRIFKKKKKRIVIER